MRAYFSAVNCWLNARRSSGTMRVRCLRRDGELALLHDLEIVHPDIEAAADDVNVRGRIPLRTGVLAVRIAKGDVDAGEFFVLKDVTDHVFHADVGADGELADPIAVFVRMGVGPEVLFEFFV